MVSQPDHGRAGHSCTSFFYFGEYLDGAAVELYNGTMELRYSGATFVKRFSSWPVTHQPSMVTRIRWLNAL